MKKLFNILLILSIYSTSVLLAQWVETNRPQGGYISCLATCLDGTGGTKIFAGTGGHANDGNGVFRSTNNGRNWTPVNNGLPAGAMISSLTVNSTNVFAGLNGGYGVYRSTNYGESWTAINNGFPSPSYPNALATYGNILFVGNIYSGGVFRSTNYGENWTAVNNGLDSSTVYYGVNAIAISGNSIFIGTQINGVFRSNDNGTSWAYCGFKDTTVMSLAVSGTKIFAGLFGLSGVYCSTNNGDKWKRTSFPACNPLAFTVSGTNIFAGTRENGIYLSADNGTNWAPVNNGLSTNYSFLSLTTSTDENGRTCILSGNNRGVYISTNNGESWAEADSGLTSIKNSVIVVSNNKGGGSNLFLGTGSSGIFLSTNNGTSWETVNEGLISGTICSVQDMVVSGTNIFANIISLYGGIYYSIDNGKNWIQTGLTNVEINAFSVRGKNIFAGTNRRGVFFSQDGGISWTEVNNGLPTTDNRVTAMIALSDHIFVSTRNNLNGKGSVYLSTNNGENWLPTNNGLPEYLLVTTFISSGTNILIGTNYGVFLSSNYGISWTNVQNGLPMNGFVTSSTSFGSNILVGGEQMNGIYLSTDNGKKWTQVNSGLPNNFKPISLAVSNTHVFAIDDKVWIRPVSEMIPSIWQTDITIKDKGNISQMLSFGKLPTATNGIDSGLEEAPLPPAPFGFDARFHLPTGDDSWKDFRSTERDSAEWLIKFQPGAGGYPITFSWDNTKLPKGNFYLKDVIIGNIVSIDMKNNSSYTLTNTGINTLMIEFTSIKTDILNKDDIELPTSYSLSQNYPNPFNPSTVIRYGLPGTSDVKIKIYNLLGQVVQSLISGAQTAGYHEVTWNASNNASGIYFCSIEAISEDSKESFRSVKKLILVK